MPANPDAKIGRSGELATGFVAGGVWKQNDWPANVLNPRRAFVPIEIRLRGLLRANGGGVRSFPSDGGLGLVDILRQLGIEPEEYSVIVVNGRQVGSRTIPQDGDVVDVYPFLGGG